jgi:hypothetical protein
VLDKADETHIHDEWTKMKLQTGKYKSSEIYPSPSDPALKKEYEEYLKKKLAGDQAKLADSVSGRDATRSFHACLFNHFS